MKKWLTLIILVLGATLLLPACSQFINRSNYDVPNYTSPSQHKLSVKNGYIEFGDSGIPDKLRNFKSDISFSFNVDSPEDDGVWSRTIFSESPTDNSVRIIWLNKNTNIAYFVDVPMDTCINDVRFIIKTSVTDSREEKYYKTVKCE